MTVAIVGEVDSDRALIVLAASVGSSTGVAAILTLGEGTAARPATGIERDTLESEAGVAAVIVVVVVVAVVGAGIEG